MTKTPIRIGAVCGLCIFVVALLTGAFVSLAIGATAPSCSQTELQSRYPERCAAKLASTLLRCAVHGVPPSSCDAETPMSFCNSHLTTPCNPVTAINEVFTTIVTNNTTHGQRRCVRALAKNATRA